MKRLSLRRGTLWAAWSVAALVGIVHFAVAGQYGAFRNELYFIVCGRHPAFGYIDQPPLVPLLAAATQSAGVHLWLLRLPAVLAAIFLVPLTVAFAQLLGASTRGAWLAAIAAASATLVTAMTATLSTSTFEPLAFTAIAYLVTRGFLLDEPRAFWWAGAIAGLEFEAKYGALFWALGLAIGMALTGPRAVFRSRDWWSGVLIAAVLALPNVAWQALHNFPFLELVHNDNAGNFTGSPLRFTINQIFSVNFVLAPLWATGIVAPFVSARLSRFRFLSIAFVIMALFILGTHGKSYYLAGAYPTMFALGAAACTGLPYALVALWAVLAAANGAFSLPLVLPVLAPNRLQIMLDRMSFRPPPVEAAGIGAPLMQMLSDEFGWPELARDVGAAYAALPPADRAKAAIFASNYGEAAAIDVYGKNLPPALSGNNQYYLWGPRGYDGSVVLAVNVDPAKWSTLCHSQRVVGRFGTSPYAMPYERDRPIVLCRGMHPPLPQLWPTFKHYGIESLGRGPASGVVVPVTTTPQPDNAGRLADRQFFVSTRLGSGYARYFGTSALDGDPTATHAIIIVHGVLRDADYYYDTGVIAADAAHALSQTLVIAPQFVERSELTGNNVSPQTLYWNGRWPGGSDAISPAPISTYDVFDAMIARLSDAQRFPKMREIVLAGHSAGGQIVQRYAVVGNAPALERDARVPVHLIVSNPSSYLYFTDWRPAPQQDCPDFDRWRYGLSGAPRYVTGTAAALEARYVARRVTYLMGTADTNPKEEDLDRSCGGEAQGPYRFARAKSYIAYIGRRHSQTNQDYAFVRGVPHDNRRIFTSPCGLAVLFGGSRSSCAAAGPIPRGRR